MVVKKLDNGDKFSLVKIQSTFPCGFFGPSIARIDRNKLTKGHTFRTLSNQ